MTTEGGHIRTILPRAMEGYIISMKHSFTVFISFIGNGLGVFGSDLAAGATLRFAVPRSMFWVVWAIPAGTLLFFSMSVLTSRYLHLQGWKDCAYLVLVTNVQGLLMGVFQTMNLLAHRRSSGE